MALKGVQLRHDCVITEHNSGHRPPSTQNMDRPTRLTSWCRQWQTKRLPSDPHHRRL